MGLRGPPAMPPEERKARGTYRSDRDPAAETAALPPGMPSLPRGMPAEARRLWRKLSRKLLDAGILSDTDGTTLERYCRAYARWRALMAKAEADGAPDATTSGAEARRWEREVLIPLGAALGLHYAARSRMRAPSKQHEPDAVEQDMFGQGLVTIRGGKGDV